MFVELSDRELGQRRLEEELAAQAAHVSAGMARLVELAAACKERLPLILEGSSFAGWLGWRCGLPAREARELERVGEALAGLPLTRAGFGRGQLSLAKVRTLTRIATAESEERLLELAAVLTASQLERSVGAYRRLATEQAADRQAKEFLHYFWTDEGLLSLRGLLSPEEGAVLLRALDAARTALRGRDRPPPPGPVEPEVVESRRVSNAEALVAVADLALAKTDADRSGGERYQVVVHVDAATLAGDEDGRCELEDGPALAAETARRVSCEGSVVELRGRDGETLSLGRKRRTVSPPLRRALAARDRGCRFPGCEARRFVDAHHVRHWSEGGETNLENLVSLCRRHHRLVHEQGYSVKLDADGEPAFTNQYGIELPNIPRSPPPSSGEALRRHHRRRRLGIDAKTFQDGCGERMRLADGVDAIGWIAGKNWPHPEAA